MFISFFGFNDCGAGGGVLLAGVFPVRGCAVNPAGAQIDHGPSTRIAAPSNWLPAQIRVSGLLRLV